jgi:release factor glutamine methyltransferase
MKTAERTKHGSNGSKTADALLRDAAHTLSRSADNLSWKGAWRDQASELLTYALGGEFEPDDAVPAAAARRFAKLVERRADGEPIPQITGYVEFDDLRLRVRKGAFVPRWTTEFLAQEAARRLRARARGSRAPVHVDLATGIGPVALAVASRVPRAQTHGVDVAAAAVKLATENARELRLRNAHFHRGDLYKPLPAKLRGKVDLITIHPPYIATQDIEDLPAEIREFEPIVSLTDKSRDGLWLLQRAAEGASEWLRPDGWFLVEIGSYLARGARGTVARAGFRDMKSLVGPLRLNRVIVARAPRG